MTQRERQYLLASAADLGIIHFDAAPSYGDGVAESEIGRFTRQARDNFIIATKYGIPAGPLLAALPSLGTPLRGIRVLARKLGVWHNTLPALSAAGLRASAERSLKRLRRDRIEILFLHEPSLQRLPDPNEILEEFLRLRKRGLIGFFGLAGPWNAIAPILAVAPELGEIVQTAEADWSTDSPPDITYGAISGGAQKYFAAGIAPDAAIVRLKKALARRPQGVVLASTTNIVHLRNIAKVVGTAP